MVISQETVSFVSSIKEFSRGRLRRADDLAVLIELSRLHHRNRLLDDLSFIAKFLVNSSSVMKRIGQTGEGYEKLTAEFSANVEKASAFVAELLTTAPSDVGRRFEDTYLRMTPDTLSSLMQLMHDLSWLKNWNIDHSLASS